LHTSPVSRKISRVRSALAIAAHPQQSLVWGALGNQNLFH
jgi:hypothetical protein